MVYASLCVDDVHPEDEIDNSSVSHAKLFPNFSLCRLDPFEEV
jgi:hypothetical protein